MTSENFSLSLFKSCPHVNSATCKAVLVSQTSSVIGCHGQHSFLLVERAYTPLLRRCCCSAGSVTKATNWMISSQSKFFQECSLCLLVPHTFTANSANFQLAKLCRRHCWGRVKAASNAELLPYDDVDYNCLYFKFSTYITNQAMNLILDKGKHSFFLSSIVSFCSRLSTRPCPPQSHCCRSAPRCLVSS